MNQVLPKHQVAF